MPKQWKPGDKVKLASGGPDMTVREQGVGQFSGEFVACDWFDKDGTHQHADFKPDQLVEVHKSPTK